MKLCVLLVALFAIANASSYYNKRLWPPGCYPSESVCESKCRGSSKACHPMPSMGPDAHMCENVECENPTAPVHGHVATPHGTDFESIAVYSCEDGYDLSYPAYRTCFKSGKWSGHAPTCDPKPECEDLDDPEHGDVTLTDGTHQGSLASYSCDADYYLSDASVRVCLTTGYWSGWAPTCIPYATCQELEDPSHGTAHFDSTIKWTIAYYTCDEGYELSYQADRVCLSTGDWSGSKPSCDPIDCGPLENPCNGLVHTPDGTAAGQQATYECKLGYVLSEEVTRTCDVDGFWTEEAPCCDPVECPNPDPPIDGFAVTPGGFSVGNIAYYRCSTCYSLVGPRKRECLADGTWSGPEPSCQTTIPGYTLVYGSSCYKYYSTPNSNWTEALMTHGLASQMTLTRVALYGTTQTLLSVTRTGTQLTHICTAHSETGFWCAFDFTTGNTTTSQMASHQVEPNDAPGNADCVRLSSDDGYQWRDTPCGDEMNFICEYEHPL